MFGLRYVEGAIPGKKLNPSPTLQKNYEVNRCPRKFNSKWTENRDWLVYDADKNVMKCMLCIGQYGETPQQSNLQGQNKFLTGCSNFRVSAITDHEKSNGHIRATEIKSAKSSNVASSAAGKALLQMREADRQRLSILFRNAHAIMKNNRPLSDYDWLCTLDKAKHQEIGSTYLNSKAALKFIEAMSLVESEKTADLVANANFFCVMMDGSTDISGDEQEAVYVRVCLKGGLFD
jgi:hypothetical protein